MTTWWRGRSSGGAVAVEENEMGRWDFPWCHEFRTMEQHTGCAGQQHQHQHQRESEGTRSGPCPTVIRDRIPASLPVWANRLADPHQQERGS